MSMRLKPRPRLRPKLTLISLLFGLIVILGLLNLGVIAAKPLFKPGAPTSGELLYATGFANPTDPDWEQYQGAMIARIADGRLQLIADTVKDNIFAPLSYTFSDFDLRVVSKQTLGEGQFGEYGVIFRYQDRGNYYIFRLRADGAYRVSRSLAGKQEDLSASTDPERVAPPFAVGLNWSNDIRIVGKGNQFQFYVNGKLLTLCPKGSDRRSTWNGDQCASNNRQTAQTLTDDTFRDGRIALAIQEDVDSITVEFDNLVIYAP